MSLHGPVPDDVSQAALAMARGDYDDAARGHNAMADGGGPGLVRRLAAARRRAGAVSGSSRQGARALLSPRGVRGTAQELAWITAHVAMYPLGILQERAQEEDLRLSLQGLPPVHRGLMIGDVEAAGTPIVLVHGIIDNRSIFTLLRRALRRRGFGRLIAVNYHLSDDVRRVARRLASVVETICRETGYERVHVVGHSMGGLVARYYVQRLGGDHRVHTLVTLGTPHAGTMPAYVLPHPLVKQLRPESDLVRELSGPAPGCRTRMVAVWSDLDQIIMPKRNARIVHPDLDARNVFIRGVGHMSLPIDGRVIHEICTTLAQLDHEGHTVRGPAAATVPG